MTQTTKGNFKLTTKNTTTDEKKYVDGKFNSIHKYQKAIKDKAKEEKK